MPIYKRFPAPFCALILGAIVGGEANAQAPAPQPRTVYAAKFICGRIAGDDDVVRGVYATSINIHNPQLTEVKFEKRVVVANREGESAGQLSQPKTDVLAPGRAMRVDCRVIAGFCQPATPYRGLCRDCGPIAGSGRFPDARRGR